MGLSKAQVETQCLHAHKSILAHYANGSPHTLRDLQTQHAPHADYLLTFHDTDTTHTVECKTDYHAPYYLCLEAAANVVSKAADALPIGRYGRDNTNAWEATTELVRGICRGTVKGSRGLLTAELEPSHLLTYYYPKASYAYVFPTNQLQAHVKAHRQHYNYCHTVSSHKGNRWHSLSVLVPLAEVKPLALWVDEPKWKTCVWGNSNAKES